jgi:hypothetical protein
MAYRNLTDAEYQQVKSAVVERGHLDAMSARWRGVPDTNESEMGAFQALRSVSPYINIVPTSQQLRELGELYIEGYMEQVRASPVSPAAGRRRRRKTKRTRLQRKM